MAQYNFILCAKIQWIAIFSKLQICCKAALIEYAKFHLFVNFLALYNWDTQVNS